MLEKHSKPVLGCTRMSDTVAHARVSCIGVLSDEFLIALCMRLRVTLQINVNRCADCVAGSVLKSVESDISNVRHMLQDVIPLDIILVDREEDLSFTPERISRRDFIKHVHHAPQSAIGVFNRTLDGANSLDFRNKMVPRARRVLNAAMEQAPGKVRAVMFARWYCTMAVGRSCDMCGLCVGLCPNGAIKRQRRNDSSAASIMFNTLFCTMCDACSEACPKTALLIVHPQPKLDGPLVS